MTYEKNYDVVVIGAGNAALCSALVAREAGASVLVLEKGPQKKRGGNSYFTDGAIRIAFNTLEDLRTLMPHMTDEQADKIVLPSYTAEQYRADFQRITQGQTDTVLSNTVIDHSLATLQWMHRNHGIQFDMIYDNQSLFGCAVYSVTITGGVVVPSNIRVAIQIAAGIMIGTTARRDLFQGDIYVFMWAIIGAVSFLALGMLFAYIAYRLGHLDQATAVFGFAPGGLTGMAVVSQEEGADAAKVVVMHFSRVFLIFFTVPFLVRWLLTR